MISKFLLQQTNKTESNNILNQLMILIKARNFKTLIFGFLAAKII